MLETHPFYNTYDFLVRKYLDAENEYLYFVDRIESWEDGIIHLCLTGNLYDPNRQTKTND
jgi:hypothetical protein